MSRNYGIFKINESDKTEYRFQVTGKTATGKKLDDFFTLTNFSSIDYQKALDLFNSLTEGTLWMVSVKKYEPRSDGRCWYYTNGQRNIMMRKGSKYVKALNK
jgi:hypothetical protein